MATHGTSSGWRLTGSASAGLRTASYPALLGSDACDLLLRCRPRSHDRIRIEHVERHALVRRLYDAHVLPAQLAGMTATAGVRDHVDLLVHVRRIARDPQEFLLHDQPTLQALVVSRDSCRTSILVTAQR